MQSLRTCLVCLLAAALASVATSAELPPKWWLITDENPFAALQQELGNNIPDALKGGPVAASAATSSEGGFSAAAGSPSSGASASAGPSTSSASAGSSASSASAEAAKAPRPPPSRFPERFPAREETIAMAGFGGAPGSEAADVPPSAGRPTRGPAGQAGQAGRPGAAGRPAPAGGQGRPSRPPTRQPGGGPIIFPTDKPMFANAESFSENTVLGGGCTCTHPTSCTDQPGAPQGKCPAGRVCCPPKHQYQAKCGRTTPQPRSSQAVRDSDAPWMAALLEKVPNGYIFVCGGSLIHEQVVLTAARCVEKFEKRRDSLVVRLGDKDILSNDEEFPPVEIAVKDIMMHANFSREQKYNDMALLFLREPAPLRPGLDTICVRRDPSSLRGCSIHSYGLRQAGSTSFDLRLREADQAPMSFRDCQRVLRGTQKGPFFNLHPSFQCTNSDVTCDLGEDRAGSPLTCPDRARGEHQLSGVVAWGVGCQSQQKPGVYTSVEEFFRWIDFQVTNYFGYFESAFGPFNQI